jgi:hypothetical protein
MRRFLLRLSVLVCAIVAAASITVRTTSFEAVTFNDLVTQSDVIFVGDVVDVHPYVLQTRDRTIVKTRVTLSVSDPLYGTSSLVEVFDFLGGETPDLGMKIAGMPAFAVGDRRVVFARRDGSINPIVGFTQGLMRVTRDAGGVDRVLTLEGAPISRLEDIGTSAAARIGAIAAPMRLSDFRTRIAQALAEARK